MPSTLTPTEFLKKTIDTVTDFGFTEPAVMPHEVTEGVTRVSARSRAEDRKADDLSGLLASGLNTYTKHHFYRTTEPILTYSVTTVPRTGEPAVVLHIFHVDKSIAESLLIQTARAIARDMDTPQHVVRINSIGDSDSVTRYTRELSGFFRKRINDLPDTTRGQLANSPFAALQDLYQHDLDLAIQSPNALESLSDSSRKHFREIIEYLDASESRYEIDGGLLGHPTVYSGTLFELTPEDTPALPLSIRGGRFDSFMQKQTERAIPAAGAVVTLGGKKGPRRTPRPHRAADPSVYVVQLGFGPKIRTLLLLDEFHAAGIPVVQNLASDSLSAQLRDAEARNIRYAVLVGQKEYVDRTVLLRDLQNRTQEIVPVEEIATRLKRARVHLPA